MGETHEEADAVLVNVVDSLPSPLAGAEMLMLVAGGRAYIAQEDPDYVFGRVRVYGLDGDGRCAALVSDGDDAAWELHCALERCHGHKSEADYLDLGGYSLAEYAEREGWPPVVTVYQAKIEFEGEIEDVLICEQDTNGLAIDDRIFYSGLPTEDALQMMEADADAPGSGRGDFTIVEVGQPEPIKTAWSDRGRVCDFDARPAVHRIVYGAQPMYLPAAEAIVAPRFIDGYIQLGFKVDVYTGIDTARLREIGSLGARGDHEAAVERLGAASGYSFTAHDYRDGGANPADAKAKTAELMRSIDFTGAYGIDGMDGRDLVSLAETIDNTRMLEVAAALDPRTENAPQRETAPRRKR